MHGIEHFYFCFCRNFIRNRFPLFGKCFRRRCPVLSDSDIGDELIEMVAQQAGQVQMSMNSSLKQTVRSTWDMVKIIVQALLIALVLRTFLFQSYNIPSGSMIPTLLIQDFLFVSKYSYGFSRYSMPFNLPLFSGRILASEPKRGDVIVFKKPTDVSQDFIKRLIGLPGDKIQMKAGRLYINGEVVPRERIDDFISNGYKIPRYIETLPNGVKHPVLEAEGDDGMLDNTEVYTVPAGHYFMMGDNRDNSQDSRVLTEVGYVPFDNLVGRAEVIFLSVDEQASAWKFWQWPWTMRGERMFQSIR